MNAPARLFLNAVPAIAMRRASACALAGLLAGCAATPFATAPTPTESAAAAAVTEGARADRAYPAFCDIPAKPDDVRPPREWARAVAAVEKDRAELYAATAPSTWTLDGTDAFASRAQAAVQPPPIAGARDNTEAFAQDLRDRATPPPPPR